MRKNNTITLSLMIGALTLGAMPVSADTIGDSQSKTVPVTDLAVYTDDNYSMYLGGDSADSIYYIYEVIKVDEDLNLYSVTQELSESNSGFSDYFDTSLYLVDDFSMEDFKDLSSLEEYEVEKTVPDGMGTETKWTLGDASGKTAVVVTWIDGVEETGFTTPSLTTFFETGVSDPNLGSAAWASVHQTRITAQEVLTGDVNRDGNVSVIDLLHLKKGLLGLEEATTLGDVNNDGSVNAVDLLQLKRFLLGLYDFTNDTVTKLVGEPLRG